MTHTYILYPVIVWIISKFFKEESYDIPKSLPEISILISAYNEEDVIFEKINNCFQSDYPLDKIEVLVGSDGSTDRTNEIIKGIKDSRVKAFCYSGRNGKSWVLNKLVKESKGEILVFSDADALFKEDTLLQLTSPFQNSQIGGVCGRPVMTLSREKSGKSAEKTYMSLENEIRKSEGRIFTTFGASGAILAIRKKLFRELPTKSPVVDDFMIPMFIIMQKLRIFYADTAIADIEITNDLFLEFRRRIRIGSRNLNGIRYYKELLKPSKGFIAFGLWSHKMLRWGAPVFLILLFISSFFLSHQLFYKNFLYFEIAFIFCATAGIILNIWKIQIKPFSFCAYFLLLNLGLLIGSLLCLFGKEKPTWDTAKRSSEED